MNTKRLEKLMRTEGFVSGEMNLAQVVELVPKLAENAAKLQCVMDDFEMKVKSGAMVGEVMREFMSLLFMLEEDVARIILSMVGSHAVLRVIDEIRFGDVPPGKDDVWNATKGALATTLRKLAQDTTEVLQDAHDDIE